MTLLKREATQTLLLDHLFSNPTLSNSRPTVAGRRAVIGKRHLGTFWMDGNVLCLDRGVGYTGIYIYENMKLYS